MNKMKGSNLKLKSKGDWKLSNMDNLDICKINATQTLNVIFNIYLKAQVNIYI